MQNSQLPALLSNLAESFAASVLAEIRRMSLDEIMAVVGAPRSAAKPGRPVKAAAAPAPSSSALPRVRRGQRRGPEEIGATVQAMVGILKKQPGLRAEQIRAQLGLARKDMDLPIAHALATKQIKKTGERRATRYFVR